MMMIPPVDGPGSSLLLSPSLSFPSGKSSPLPPNLSSVLPSFNLNFPFPGAKGGSFSSLDTPRLSLSFTKKKREIE